MAENTELVGRTFGGFRLREKIGAGGCGEVYLCDQAGLGRNAVVKVLHERQRHHGELRLRFLREAKLAAQLRHPFAAHVYDSGADGDILWIAMEYVQGVTLADWLKKHGPMSLAQFVPFFHRMAQVVHEAHQRGIIHRDLKPSNVMVIDGEDAGEECLMPKLLDLGIAAAPQDFIDLDPPTMLTGERRHESAPGTVTAVAPLPACGPIRLTRVGARMGSTAYMSPEQWHDPHSVGPAADIYSLGVIIYEALTGRMPFEVKEHEYHERVQLPPLGRDLPDEIHDVVRRALDDSPKARQGSAPELAAELRAALRSPQRALIRTSAEQWRDHGRPVGMLWGRDVLATVGRRASSKLTTLGDLESAFLTASSRHARRVMWAWRMIGIVGVASVVIALQCRATTAQRTASAVARDAELEQGRAALLHGELEAAPHLKEAYDRGDHSVTTAFMLARALEPRQAEKARLNALSGRMWAGTYSPDHQQIVTGDDGGAQIWDATTYQLRFTLPHPGAVYGAIYSADSARMITACKDGVVRIWDALSGSLIRELRSGGDPRRYWSVVMSAQGDVVAAIDVEGNATTVWNADTAAVIAEIRNGGGQYPSLSISGRWLAASGGDDVRIFDLTMRTQVSTLPGPHVRTLAFDSSAARLVTGSATGAVVIWNIPRGEPIQQHEMGEPVEAVVFSPDGELVAAGTRGGTEQIWHLATGRLTSQLGLHGAKIKAMEFDPTSKRLLAATGDGRITVSDALDGLPLAVFDGPAQGVSIAHFDGEGMHIVGVSSDGTARVWDAEALYRRWSSEPTNDECGIVSSAEPDRRFVAVGCRGYVTRVWDTANDRLIAGLPGIPHSQGDNVGAFPAVAQTGDLAAEAHGNEVDLYAIPGGNVRSIQHGATVNTIAFAPATRDLVSGASDGSVIVTRESGAQLFLPKGSAGIDCVTLLEDHRVVVADAHRRLRIYGLDGILRADREIPVRVMGFRVEGHSLVLLPSYLSGGDPVLFDLDEYRVVASLTGHIGGALAARWVAGHRILTAGMDGTARLWDGAAGRALQVYRGGAGFLADAALGPEGLVMAGGEGGQLLFWGEADARLVWSLQANKSSVIAVHMEADDFVTRGFDGQVSRWHVRRSPALIALCEPWDRCGIVAR